jgi:molybdopterin molybdotransferase
MVDLAPTPAPGQPAGLLNLSLEQALARLAELAAQHRLTATETLPTSAALGRMLAVPVVSLLDVPPADNSAMDGYALRAADATVAGLVLPVSQRIAAGQVGQPLQAGTAARIFTGAPLPPGADTVVMQEHCEALTLADTAAHTQPQAAVKLLQAPVPGAFVRRLGEDVQHGAQVLAAGQRLTPQALGLGAAVGAATLTVVRRPRVMLFSSGNELVMPGEPLPPGAIYNSNRYTLRGLLEAAGCDVTDGGIVPDQLAATRAALRAGAQAHDVILSSGGVSVGEEDHLRAAAQAEGQVAQWLLAAKPGRPLAVGVLPRASSARSALWLGLPGNPVSSFVTFLLAVAPLLRGLQGGAVSLPPALPLRAAFDWPQPDRRREFLRARITPEGELECFGNQSSGVLTSAVWADGLIDNPAGHAIARGDTVRFLPLAPLIGA